MTIPFAAACLLLIGSDGSPAAAAGPGDPQASAPSFEVMLVRSGVELILKMDGGPTTIRLLGVETPRVGRDLAVERLSQKNFLYKLIPFGTLVRITGEGGATWDPRQGSLPAQVYRATDGLWINRHLIEQGYATTSPNHFPARPSFEAAERHARESHVGMWAPDFLQHAAQPARFDRVQRPRPRPTARPAVAMPLPGPVGLDPVAPAPIVGFSGSTAPESNPNGYGRPFGGYGPVANHSDPIFTKDANGRPLSQEETQRRILEFLDHGRVADLSDPIFTKDENGRELSQEEKQRRKQEFLKHGHVTTFSEPYFNRELNYVLDADGRGVHLRPGAELSAAEKQRRKQDYLDYLRRQDEQEKQLGQAFQESIRTHSVAPVQQLIQSQSPSGGNYGTSPSQESTRWAPAAGSPVYSNPGWQPASPTTSPFPVTAPTIGGGYGGNASIQQQGLPPISA
ncbi:MAG TPA: thermonuclease family protein, partial [Isosphaeraceae bacterium]